MTAKEKLEVLQYAEKNGIQKAADKFKITDRTIFRWKSKYDGTLKSLENNFSRKGMPHPNEHTEEEIENIKYLLKTYPYISHTELYEKLKTEYNYKRHPGSLYNYLRRNRIIPEPKLKNEYSTMFDSKAVKRLNGKFVFANKEKLPLYVIELNENDIFIAKEVNNGYPCYLTVYYSTALKFTSKEDALNFISSIKNTSNFKMTIRELNL